MYYMTHNALLFRSNKKDSVLRFVLQNPLTLSPRETQPKSEPFFMQFMMVMRAGWGKATGDDAV